MKKSDRKKIERYKDPVYTVHKSEIERIRKDAYDAGIEAGVRDGFALMFCMPLMVLYSRYGWKRRKRLPAFAEAVLDEFRKFQEGDMTAEEYQKFVYENCGMKFEAE
jgi:hypothetical protein